jgi:anti-sigma B factor antagonist
MNLLQRYYLSMPQEPLQIEDINGTPQDYRVLRLSGPITISNFFQFQSLVRSNASRKLILDLSGVPYIDSAGIGVLVGAYVTQQKDGRSLAFVGVSQRVRDAMQVTRVEQFFRFYDTEAAAQQGLTN